MEKAEHMNYIALNQNILRKSIIIGQGIAEGTDENPIQTSQGFEVYLNGQHKIPEEPSIAKEHLFIGKIQHPYVMMGMPDCSGELIYSLLIYEEAYVVIISLKIDEIYNGESEPAVDALAYMKRTNSNINDNDYGLVSKEMLLCHFDRLFEFYQTKDEMQDWEFEGDFINEVVDEYFDHKADLKEKEDELGIKSKKSDSSE